MAKPQITYRRVLRLTHRESSTGRSFRGGVAVQRSAVRIRRFSRFGSIVSTGVLAGLGVMIGMAFARQRERNRLRRLAPPPHTLGLSPFRTTRGWTHTPMPVH